MTLPRAACCRCAGWLASRSTTCCPRTRHVAIRDVPVGWYVERRLGREVVDRLVDPLLGGVYAGHAERALAGRDRARAGRAGPARPLAADGRTASRRSRATAVARHRASSPVFASLRGGLGRLPAAVAEASGARVLTGRTVRELRRTPTGWRLVVGSTARLGADRRRRRRAGLPGGGHPAPAERRRPAAGEALAGLGYASVAIITMVFDEP